MVVLLISTSGPYAAADFVCDAMSFQKDLLPFPCVDAAYSHLRGADGSRCLRPAATRDSDDAPTTAGESNDSRVIARPVLSQVL